MRSDSKPTVACIRIDASQPSNYIRFRRLIVKDIKVLSLFSGCGGMDLGLEGDFAVHKSSVSTELTKSCSADHDSQWVRLPRTRFKTVLANDILREAKAAYVPYFANRGSEHPFVDDSVVDLVKMAESGEYQFPSVDVVTGGFPCQDFSVAGKRLGLNSHRSHNGCIEKELPNEENRGQLYIWMKKVIELTGPRMFIAENVRGLVSLGDVKEQIENDFRSIGSGYVVLNARILHSGNYGVPQARERVFFLGFNKDYITEQVIAHLSAGLIDPYPPKTHSLPGENDSSLLPFVPLSAVLADLPEPEFAMDPAQKAYSGARYYGRHVQGQAEVDLSALGPTIRAEHHGNIEFRRLGVELGGKYPDEISQGKIQRRLTVRECARIQTFPDDYQFVRHKGELGPEFALSPSGAYRVIGNAVPPLLGFNIARTLEGKWHELFGD